MSAEPNVHLTLEQKLERLWDQNEVRKLMGRYAFCGYARTWEKVPKMFATRDDIWIDCEGFGVFDGAAGVERFFVHWHHSMEGDAKGIFSIHTLTTEVIEVAADGETARGLWISPGAESRRTVPDNQLESFWIWGLYAIDFIKEDGEWKFWHFRIPHLMLSDYHSSWNDLDRRPSDHIGDTIANDGRPAVDRPSTFEPTFYRGQKRTSNFFEPPAPYRTFADVATEWTLDA
jgi:hypothetical protein